eukprot:s641_g8.t1
MKTQRADSGTPYMPGWGDGSAAKTCDEAKSLWKKAKAMEKQMQLCSSEDVIADLVVELGDVQFTLLLSLFIIGRDFGVDPVHILQTLSSQDPFNLESLFLLDQFKSELRKVTSLNPLQASIPVQIEPSLVLQMGVPDLITLDGSTTTSVFTIPTDDSAFQEQSNLATILVISAVSLCFCSVVCRVVLFRRKRLREESQAAAAAGERPWGDSMAMGWACADPIPTPSPNTKPRARDHELSEPFAMAPTRGPTAWESNAAVAAACKGRASWQEAAGLLLQLPAERVAPDSYAGSAVLHTVSRGRWDGSLQLWSWLHQCAPSACDEFTGSAVLNGCARNRRWAEAVGTLATLRAWGGRLDVVTCSAAVSACERAQPSEWPRALRTLRETPEDPNEFTFSAAASACEKANLWQNSLGLLFELRRTPRKRGTPSEQGPKTVLQPTVVSHAATLSACAGGRKWPWVMWLFQKIQYQKDLDVVVFGAVITACDALGGRYWQLALHLLQRAAARGLRTSAELLGAGVKACEAAMQWPWAVQLLRYHIAVGTEPGAFAGFESLQSWRAGPELSMHSGLPPPAPPPPPPGPVPLGAPPLAALPLQVPVAVQQVLLQPAIPAPTVAGYFVANVGYLFCLQLSYEVKTVQLKAFVELRPSSG